MTADYGISRIIEKVMRFTNVRHGPIADGVSFSLMRRENCIKWN